MENGDGLGRGYTCDDFLARSGYHECQSRSLFNHFKFCPHLQRTDRSAACFSMDGVVTMRKAITPRAEIIPRVRSDRSTSLK